MKNIMADMANAISEKMEGIVEEKAIKALTYSEDISAITAFYCASKLIGKDIVTLENETIEYALLSKKVNSKIVRKVIMAKSMIGDLDRVLTIPEYFSVAVDVFNDDDVDTSIVDYKRPEKIIWALVILMSISSAENILVSGGAVGYIVAILKADGWTMPPLMLNVQKFSDMFEYYDDEVYKTMACTQKNMMISCALESKKDISSAQENFMELHKPIIHYIISKAQDLNEEVGKISS